MWKQLFVAECKITSTNCTDVFSEHFKDPCTSFKDFYPMEAKFLNDKGVKLPTDKVLTTRHAVKPGTRLTIESETSQTKS